MKYLNKTDLWIEITNRCRLECTKCSRTPLIGIAKNIDLPVEDFEKIASSNLYKSIFFCGSYGDCIYHPQFKEIVKIAKQYDIGVIIHTNGSGKKLSWWIEILEMLDPNKDAIYIAMDGYKETSGNYRINFSSKDFDFNIQLMSLATNKYKIKTIWVYIPMNFNEMYVKEAAKLAIDNNIIFCVKKSVRWSRADDPMLPLNKNYISKASRVGSKLP